jgi:hypothetical protein
MVDRVSESVVPHDTAIGEVARTSRVNSMDETSWLMHGDRHGLWGIAHPLVAYFPVHTSFQNRVCVAHWRLNRYPGPRGLSCLSRLARPPAELLGASEPRSPRTGSKCRSRDRALWEAGARRAPPAVS